MYEWRELVELYKLTMAPPSNLQPRYNICLTDTIDVVVSGGGERTLVPMRWGLVPGWWKKPLKEMKVATFNARSDTIADKPMFRDSFKRRRCLIPASGYYEWVTTPEGKQPYYFTRQDGQVITIAGVQDGWTDPQSGERLRSCSMVITEANQFVVDVHDRMPVILEAEHFEQWMDGDANDAADLLNSYNAQNRAKGISVRKTATGNYTVNAPAFSRADRTKDAAPAGSGKNRRSSQPTGRG
jgi:putative SOS response-associated peptidase YedK